MPGGRVEGKTHAKCMLCVVGFHAGPMDLIH
jgi:hypothetical protein